MKRFAGSALVLLGAMCFYALGRWGGAAPADLPRALAALLGTDGAAPLLGIVVAGLLLGTGMFVLGAPALAPDLDPTGPRIRPTQVVAGLNALVVLGCLLLVTIGVSAGWSRPTIAVGVAIAIVEIVVGLALAPVHLRSGGPRSVSAFSLGAILVGLAWAGSVIVLGTGGA